MFAARTLSVGTANIRCKVRLSFSFYNINSRPDILLVLDTHKYNAPKLNTVRPGKERMDKIHKCNKT